MPPANFATAPTWRTSSARLHGSPWMQMSLDTRVEHLYHRVGAWRPKELKILIDQSAPETHQDGATGAGRDVRESPVASNARQFTAGRRRQFKTRFKTRKRL